MNEERLELIATPSRRTIACRYRPGSGPALMFLPGYASDMEGTKARALNTWAGEHGLAVVRFDYSGTGSSPGAFPDGTLQRWLEDTLAVLDQLAPNQVILVGSSMGGWIGLHAALLRPDRVAALVGIAAAPDFTDWGFTERQKQELQAAGELRRANPYGGESQLTTRAFWTSGQQLLLLDRQIGIGCPVRLIHGDQDEDVPLGIGIKLLERLCSADVQLTVVKGGRHRMSEPHEIEAILRTVAALVEPLT